jgi:proprotein convertase subtilisin/kexin type 5
MQICPTSTNNLTIVGYYGSILTMTCYPCPTPCSNCNINMIRNNYPTLDCGSDIYCSKGLSCTSCLAGYTLVSGKCIISNRCRKYAYYLSGNVSTAWSPSKCICLEGYYMNNYVSCDIRCDITCKNCTGTLSSNCAACNEGYTLSGGSCINSQVAVKQIWLTGTS